MSEVLRQGDWTIDSHLKIHRAVPPADFCVLFLQLVHLDRVSGVVFFLFLENLLPEVYTHQ